MWIHYHRILSKSINLLNLKLILGEASVIISTDKLKGYDWKYISREMGYNFIFNLLHTFILDSGQSDESTNWLYTALYNDVRFTFYVYTTYSRKKREFITYRVVFVKKSDLLGTFERPVFKISNHGKIDFFQKYINN